MKHYFPLTTILSFAVLAQPVAAAIDVAPSALKTSPAVEAAELGDKSTTVVTGARPRTESSSCTKMSAPIADLGTANLNQALRFVAGVTTEQRGSSAEVYDQFKLRGFNAPQFLDGLKLTGGAG